MTPEMMRAYHARFYHPGNATLVIAGDVQPAAALRAARRHFGKIPAGPEPEPAFALQAPTPGASSARLTLAWDDQGKRLCMAWPTVSVGTDADYDLDVLSEVLTGGNASRLVKRLVEDEGIATSISTSNDTRVAAGVFWLFAECAGGVAPEILEAAIDEELRRLVEERVPRPELKRVVARIISGDVQQGETISELAEELGSMAVDATWELAFDGGLRHKLVTPKRIQRTAEELLSPERRILGWSLPMEERAARLGGQA